MVNADKYAFARTDPYHSSKQELIELLGDREGASVWNILIEAIKDADKVSDTNVWIEWMSRIKAGEPVQYITGRAWFYDLELKVDPSVLIPRAETEELVHWAGQWVKSKGIPTGVAIDWGTGSGCIALAFKKLNPQWRVIAREISEEALKVAEENAEKNGLEIILECSDMLQQRSLSERQPADIIFSNPPYISVGERNIMPESILNYEPFMALFSPETDPLLFYRALEKRASEELKESGIMLLEVNEFRANATALIYEEKGWFTKLEKDLSGKNRMLMISRNADQLVNYQLV